MRRLSPLIASLVAVVLGAHPAPSSTAARRVGRPVARFVAADSIAWPAGTEVLPFENLEGIILVRGALSGRSEADTSGPLALDTGAGYLALDLGLARVLDLADSATAAEPVDIAPRPLPRLTLGSW